MATDKNMSSGNTDMLVLSLIEEKDMYGYQIIDELVRRSDHTFELKTGTLYPLLHLLEQKQYLESYDGEVISGKVRKYYRITHNGRQYLQKKRAEWEKYSSAVNRVMSGGALLAGV
ncbi:MAG: PadR family transcriptional regulator [Clostridiales bacterium]|nr:PadR family transcriptional regulator [Clostridiales bacterium]